MRRRWIQYRRHIYVSALAGVQFRESASEHTYGTVVELAEYKVDASLTKTDERNVFDNLCGYCAVHGMQRLCHPFSDLRAGRLDVVLHG